MTHAQLATSLAEGADRPLDLARAHAREAQILAFRGDWPAADSHASAARAAAERIPLVLAVAAAVIAGVSLAFARGDLPGVLVATEPVRARRLLAVGGCPGIYNWRAMEADALTGLGRLGDAEAALNEFAASIPEAGLASAAMALNRCRDNLAIAIGEAARAEAAFARAHSIEADVSMPFEHAILHLDDGRRLRAVGDPPAAMHSSGGLTISSLTLERIPSSRPAPPNRQHSRSRYQPMFPLRSGSVAPSLLSLGWSRPVSPTKRSQASCTSR